MTKMVKRRAAKRDANERDIVAALEARGHKVMRLDEFDLLVCRSGDGHLRMLEVKSPSGSLTDAQGSMLHQGWPLLVVRDVAQAILAVENP